MEAAGKESWRETQFEMAPRILPRWGTPVGWIPENTTLLIFPQALARPESKRIDSRDQPEPKMKKKKKKKKVEDE